MQTIGARFAHGEITLEEAAELGCRACASPAAAASSSARRRHRRWSGEALGMSLTHSALAPSGHPIWLDMARRSARAADGDGNARTAMRDIADRRRRVHNAMVTHAAFGGSTNLLLHLPAIAHAAGLTRPDGGRLDAHQSPGAAAGGRAARTVREMHPTVQVFLAGGVPEVMLHLRRAGLLETDALDRERRDAGRATRLVGAIGTSRDASAACCGSATASIRTTSSCRRMRRGERGTDFDG